MRTAAGRWERLGLRWESALCCAVLCGGGMGFRLPAPVLPPCRGEAAHLPPRPIPHHPAQTPLVCPQTQGSVQTWHCFHHGSVLTGVI